jgi:homoserine kinase type II
MAVYTEVSDEELEAFVAEYDIGGVESCKGIAEGVENSNYLLQTDRATYILTLYEKRVARDDLPFFLGLMDHLAARDFPSPVPIHGKDGAALRDLCGRPAAIISFLSGMWPRRVTPAHCRSLGIAAARLHVAAADFSISRSNNLSLAGWRDLVTATAGGADDLSAGLGKIVSDEISYLESAWPTNLPSGVIHADLFPDNVFFLHNELSGIIDFYFACNDFLAYDIAVCLNAWCFEGDGSFNITKARNLVQGYATVRPFATEEIAALPVLARGAALRFLLTRLYDWLNHPEGALVKRKDPLEYLRQLTFHQSVIRAAEYGLDSV